MNKTNNLQEHKNIIFLRCFLEGCSNARRDDRKPKVFARVDLSRAVRILEEINDVEPSKSLQKKHIP